jgi:hypothetical protein
LGLSRRGKWGCARRWGCHFAGFELYLHWTVDFRVGNFLARLLLFDGDFGDDGFLRFGALRCREPEKTEGGNHEDCDCEDAFHEFMGDVEVRVLGVCVALV